MLYFDIIIKELKALVFFENYVFTIFFIFFLILFYNLYINLYREKLRHKSIVLIRFIIVILLIPLINNNVFNKYLTSYRN